MSDLLSVRNKMKAKKPEFERTDSNIFKQFRGTWRKPKGIHNKLRRGFKGHKNLPSIGYSSPTDVKGLTRKGMISVLISNVSDLSKVKSGFVAVVAHGVGTKKRVQILTKAKEMKITIVGIKDIDVYLTQINEKRNSEKKEADTKKEAKKKKLDEAAKKGEKKDEPKK